MRAAPAADVVVSGRRRRHRRPAAPRAIAAAPCPRSARPRARPRRTPTISWPSPPCAGRRPTVSVRSTVPSGSSSPASGGIARYGTSRPSPSAGPSSGSSRTTATASSNSSALGSGWRALDATAGAPSPSSGTSSSSARSLGVVVDRRAHGARGHRLVGRVERLERDEPRLRAVQLGAHRVVLERRPRRLLEPVGIRPPRLDRHVQLAGHANDPPRRSRSGQAAVRSSTSTNIDCGIEKAVRRGVITWG